ncbi:hypothetical protein IWW54_002559 [Coemansia sp. RSA 2705]|nr:hypothetical protein IWW54_002559 [Coemansia sp. RSA 2705]
MGPTVSRATANIPPTAGESEQVAESAVESNMQEGSDYEHIELPVEDTADEDFVDESDSAMDQASDTDGVRLTRRQRMSTRLNSVQTEVQRPRRRRRLLRGRRATMGDQGGYESSPTRGRAHGHAASLHEVGIDGGVQAARRRVAPSLVAALADPGTESAGTEADVATAPTIIDKPREERSYREFFPDLNVHVPLTVQGADSVRVPSEGLSTPVSRTSSSLSIKLVFNDPTPRGKTLSAVGAAQSAVVVLAPKRPAVTLPAARFERVTAPKTKAVSRPESHYIRNQELSETDLAERVEYDLDDVDRAWLARLNAERSAQSQTEISAPMLEAIMDGMEKQWFDLVKDAQKAVSAQRQEQLAAESACAICGEDECDNTNAIVFCDGCNLGVHQDCYGVPYIPEGQWLCRRCMLSPDADVACELCPQRGGALKKTTANKWAHVLCALWIPETGIANAVYMEPVDGVEQIPKSRWRLTCHLCHRRAGACIQCSHRQCVVAFHATCARRAHLSMTVKPDRRTGEPVFRAYCERHTPASHAQAIDTSAPLRAESSRRSALMAASHMASLDVGKDKHERELVTQALAGSEEASLQLTVRVFDPDRPLLNEYVIARVAAQVPQQRIGLLQRTRLVAMVARYWALKRRARHGAPLLKRLHLEPWTASATQQQARELAEEQRQHVVRRIRTDLERVRLLTESVRRREREKLRRARLQVEYLQRLLYPLRQLLLPIVDELISKRDPRGVLSRPVTEAEAPDYFEVVKEPMDFGTMRARVEANQYTGLSDFEQDLRLVVRNCMTYNKPNTYYFQLAARVSRHIDRLMGDVRARAEHLPIDPESGCLQVPLNPEIFTFNLDVLPPLTEVAVSGAPEIDRLPETDRLSEQEPPATAVRKETMSAESKPEESKPEENVEPEQKAPEPAKPEPRVTRSQKPLSKANRRLTLFEQLSLPPPDVRGRMRERFAQQHENASMPDSDIPDDINVLKTRLRNDSPSAKRKRQDNPTPQKRRAGHVLQKQPSELPSSGTVVWAKMASYPWFPAEVCEQSNADVPSAVVGAAKEGETTLVRFYGASGAQWRWVTPEQVRLLGVDAAVDCELYRARRARSTNMVKSVRTAYNEACAAKNITPLAPGAQ